MTDAGWVSIKDLPSGNLSIAKYDLEN